MSLLEKLKKKGRQEGRQEGKVDAVIIQLERKLSITLSRELVDKLKNSDNETLNDILYNMFDIESEEDVKKFL